MDFSNSSLCADDVSGGVGNPDDEKYGDADVFEDAMKPSLYFSSGSFCLPHPLKVDKGGEDAHFATSEAVGVFDGVGSWEAKGIDSGEFSRELSRRTLECVEENGVWFIADALWRASTNCEKLGSSTATVAAVCEDYLIGVHLGDSGCIVIRGGKVIFRTEDQQHSFNCPYQIGHHRNDLDKASGFSIPIEEGDMIIFATDGLWDNVYEEVVVSSVKHYLYNLEKGIDNDEVFHDFPPLRRANEEDGVNHASEIAYILTKMAEEAAKDAEWESPFSGKGKEDGLYLPGGKEDDITVVVAFVEREAQGS